MNTEIYNGKKGLIEYLDSKTTGDVIVFVHGAGSNLTQFDDQIQEFSKDFRVIALSMAGHGKSRLKGEITQEKLSFENMASQLIELMDFLNIERFHVVGNSAGGVVGLEVLRANFDRLKTITIFGTAPKMNLPNYAVKIINLIDRTMLKIAQDFYINAIIKHSSKNEKTREKFRTLVMENDKETIIEFRKNLGNYDYVKEIENCKLPLMIIKSQYDKDINRSLVKFEKQFKENPKVSIINLENAGHIANVDNPKEFNKIVREFIENESRN